VSLQLVDCAGQSGSLAQLSWVKYALLVCMLEQLCMLLLRLMCCCCCGTAADIGDIDNARALYERVLIEDTNRKSTKLWEHYLAFEFEMGDLQTALRLEKRAREALGEAPGAPAGGGASARNIQLLLLRYQFNESLPCPPGQRVYLEYLMGRGPAPAGFEKPQRPSRTGSNAAAASDGDGDR
jgi:hypothetical protein